MRDLRLFFRYVIPSMFVMFVAGLYNIVDSAFIGIATGEKGLGACMLTFPIFCTIFGIGDMIGIGASILISQHRGEGNLPMANRAFSKMIGLAILAGVLIPLLFFPILKPMLVFCGATPELLPGAFSYISWVVGGAFIPVLWLCLAAAMRNDERPVLTMFLVCTGVVANVILDYVFIFLCGWGLPGASIATVISQLFPLSLAVLYFRSSRTHLKILWHAIFPSRRWCWQILKFGFPSLGGSLSIAAMLLFHNWQSLRYGQMAGYGTGGLAAYAVICTTESLISMIMQGVANGMQPIVSYIHGTGDHARNRKMAHYGIVFSVFLGILGVIFSIVARHHIPALMGLDGSIAELAAHGLLLSAPAFFALGLVKMGSHFFQSTGKILAANLLIYGDYCVILPMCLFLLPLFWGLDGVWMAMPVSRFLLLFLLMWLWKYHYQKWLW
ncbi:MAG: MATE family efflux transporter [Planctomycetia bacterium]|nr:MATE family efflux transporter [Planctomycetia bacterium]